MANLAEAQFGIFQLRQLVPISVTRAARQHRVRSGAWVHLFDGVYRLAGVPPSWSADTLAACWAGGPGAAVSHRTAAALWSLPGRQSSPIEITCPRWRRSQQPGLVVHETTVFGDADLGWIDGIPVSTVPRTLLDLGAVCSPLIVEMAVDNALRRRLVTMSDLHAALSRLGRPGRNGAGVLRSILDERGDRGVTESEMETLLLKVIRRNGLPRPVVQFVVRENGHFVARPDAAYGPKIAVEYESYEHHTGKAALVRDIARRNRLIAAGWIVITATAADLQAGGDELCRAIRSAVASRDPRLCVTDACQSTSH